MVAADLAYIADQQQDDSIGRGSVFDALVEPTYIDDCAPECSLPEHSLWRAVLLRALADSDHPDPTIRRLCGLYGDSTLAIFSVAYKAKLLKSLYQNK